ncbi:MAG: 50S ribosomal protein L11 methyltransferase [Parvularcula sp.]
MTLKLIWTGRKDRLQSVETLLSEVLYPPADALSLVKTDATLADEEADWELHAYFETPPDETGLRDLLAGLGCPPPTREDLPDRDWVAHSLAGLGVVEAGGFVLFGKHDADKVQERDGIPIQIDANRAFGTGHHPTTAGCLTALGRLAKPRPQQVLDVGTGSGVLAIAARKLWPKAAIFGTDIDEPSIAIARENAALNHAPDITFEVADGLGDFVAAHGKLPLILANILADPLIALAPDIEAALAPGGRLVLAGLLERQEAAVTEAYVQAGLTVIDRVDDETWPVLILNRPNLGATVEHGLDL